VSAVSGFATASGLQTLWFDEASLTCDRVRELRKQGLRLRAAKDAVATLRQRKDAGELMQIRTAIRRAEGSFRALLATLKAGMTEREVSLRLEWLMRERGARRAAFDIIVASGKNGALPHASAMSRRLRTGDLVTIDFGAEANGYFCDITRTVCIGRPTTRQREAHALVLRAQRAAIGAIRAGVLCSDVDKAARDVIAAAGQGDRFGHATGHGIGLMVHEAPSLSWLSKGRLEPGMVVTVEPGVYHPGWGGIRIEDMVLVTEKGPRLMTSLPRGLED
jgi:Xaa-Pro aminopeptidase